MITKEELSVIMESVGDLVDHKVAAALENAERSYLSTLAGMQGVYDGEISKLEEQIGNVIEDLPDSLGAIKEDLEAVAVRVRNSISADDLDAAMRSCASESEATVLKHVEDVRTLVGEVLVEDRDQLEISLRMDLEQVHENLAELEVKIAESSERHKEGLQRVGSEIIAELEERLSKTQERIELGYLERLKSHDLQIQRQRSEDQVRVMELLAEYRRLPDARHIVDWQPDTTYDIGTNVRYRSGLWSNLKTTDEVPGEGVDWVCTSTAIDTIKVLDKHPNGVSATVGIYDSLGKEHLVSFDLPTVNRLPGSWVEGGKYLQLDSVMCDGVRWIATKDNPAGKPGDGEGWVIESMRGPAGKRGQPGKLGPIGPVGPPGEVLSAEQIAGYVKSVEPEGMLMRRWRGDWLSGESYLKGDLVRRDTGMFLASRDNMRDPLDTVSGDWEYIMGAGA